MKRLAACLIAGFFLLGPALPVSAADSPYFYCQDGCSAEKCGPFMCGISEACADSGNCTLVDIETVIHNLGNFSIAVVGILVLLMAVFAGFLMLLGGANPAFYTKGKAMIRYCAIGVAYVFFAYAGVKSLDLLLRTGTVPDDPGVAYVICGPGETNKGKACGPNQVCDEFGQCITECDDQTREEPTIWSCIDINDTAISHGSCLTGLCPGPENIQCCDLQSSFIQTDVEPSL